MSNFEKQFCALEARFDEARKKAAIGTFVNWYHELHTFIESMRKALEEPSAAEVAIAEAVENLRAEREAFDEAEGSDWAGLVDGIDKLLAVAERDE